MQQAGHTQYFDVDDGDSSEYSDIILMDDSETTSEALARAVSEASYNRRTCCTERKADPQPVSGPHPCVSDSTAKQDDAAVQSAVVSSVMPHIIADTTKSFKVRNTVVPQWC